MASLPVILRNLFKELATVRELARMALRGTEWLVLVAEQGRGLVRSVRHHVTATYGWAWISWQISPLVLRSC